MSVWATDPAEREAALRCTGRGYVCINGHDLVSKWPRREAQKLDFAERMITRAEGYLPGFNASIDRSTMMLVSPYEAQEWMGSPVGTEMGCPAPCTKPLGFPPCTIP